MTSSRTLHVKEWLKGPLIAALAMLIYAIALGLFLALTLLVIAMEEGGDDLTTMSVPLTEAVILLSQGSGFDAGTIRLTLIPLLLTVLLIGMIRSLAIRFDAGWQAYITGVVSWIVINLLLSQGVVYTLADEMWLIALKCAVVFTIGFALAALASSSLIPQLRDAYYEHVSLNIRRTVRIGIGLAAAVLVCYLICGIITVGVWVVLNWRAMGEVFEISGMQIGSRILTTICSVAWLPNLCIWAMSWLFGGGFVIGELADFTLWIGQASDLPAVPVFGLFPEPVDNDVIRIILLSIPIAVGLVFGMVTLLVNRGFRIRVGGADDPSDWRRLIELFAYPAAAFCVSGALISLGLSALFALSNGSLGHERLAHIGVDVVSSTRTVAQPTALGLLAAWLLVLIGVSAVFGVRWIMRRRRRARNDGSFDSQTGESSRRKRQQDSSDPSNSDPTNKAKPEGTTSDDKNPSDKNSGDKKSNDKKHNRRDKQDNKKSEALKSETAQSGTTKQEKTAQRSQQKANESAAPRTPRTATSKPSAERIDNETRKNARAPRVVNSQPTIKEE